MNSKKIRKLRLRIDELRGAGGLKTKQLERLAKQLGRKRHPRGKEPTWVSELFPDARPISIPAHSSVNRFTARNILDRLEADLDEIEAHFEGRN